MATQKPISTISYNTEAFLREKLNSWLSAHIIQAYQYICHKGEDGDKDHIHLRIEPNKKLDPMDLQEALREYVQGKEKPLGCRPFRPSKEEDWFLYAVHNPDYLKLKYGGGEKGEKIPYSWQDIRVPDDYDCEVAYIRAQASLKHSQANIATRLQRGESASDLVLEGENVFLLNAISRCISVNDYNRMASELRETRERLNSVCDAIDLAGFNLDIDDDNHFKLVPKS